MNKRRKLVLTIFRQWVTPHSAQNHLFHDFHSLLSQISEKNQIPLQYALWSDGFFVIVIYFVLSLKLKVAFLSNSCMDRGSEKTIGDKRDSNRWAINGFFNGKLSIQSLPISTYKPFHTIWLFFVDDISKKNKKQNTKGAP